MLFEPVVDAAGPGTVFETSSARFGVGGARSAARRHGEVFLRVRLKEGNLEHQDALFFLCAILVPSAPFETHASGFFTSSLNVRSPLLAQASTSRSSRGGGRVGRREGREREGVHPTLPLATAFPHATTTAAAVFAQLAIC